MIDLGCSRHSPLALARLAQGELHEEPLAYLLEAPTPNAGHWLVLLNTNTRISATHITGRLIAKPNQNSGVMHASE